MPWWSYPTSIRFGAGSISELAAACVTAGIQRPLLVTDPGLVALAPVLAAREQLDSAGFTFRVFSDLTPNPTGSDATAGVQAFTDGGHDGVVAIGGGSALDVGKIIAFMAGQTQPVWAFEDVGDNWARADADAIAPVVAVPTTAGTGSEVGRAGVLVKEDEKRKFIVFHPQLLPVEVIADPELTVGLPPALTAGTGMDALSHSLEALCAPTMHPMSHGIGLEGCRLVLEHLPRVMADPYDIESRGQMLAAATMGAVAFQKGLGAMHSLSHPIGVHFGTHHGTTNAVVMPYVLLANRSAIEPTIEALARYAGISGGFDGFLDRILMLRSEIGIPHTLADLGVSPDAVDPIVADAVVDPTAATNPLPFDQTLATAMFDAAMTGTLSD